MLELKQTQKLSPVLTLQLQQAIKLLQLSKLELTEAIEQEIKENPILEVLEETPEEQPMQESSQSRRKKKMTHRILPIGLSGIHPPKNIHQGTTENCLIMRTLSARLTIFGTT